eukprot:Hpha_TRINITY_DN35528_c0_g1::TRINITY_DN35528_c0_g1_i1::g.84451::m.84451
MAAVLCLLQALGATVLTVGDGSPASCTEAALRAVWASIPTGGVDSTDPADSHSVEFECGPPCTTVTIQVSEPFLINRGALRIGVDTTKHARVVLDGGGKTRILVFGTMQFVPTKGRVFFNRGLNKEVTLEGLTFANGLGAKGKDPGKNDWANMGQGGCVVFGYEALSKIKNCRFTKCKAETGGGAFHSLGTGIHVYDTVFEDNDGGDKGGAFEASLMAPRKGDIATADKGLTLQGCVFEHNTCVVAGGGFWFTGLSGGGAHEIRIEDCRFTANRQTQHPIDGVDRLLNAGGGGFLRTGDDSKLII